MNPETLVNIILGAVNTFGLLYFAWRKLKPEVKKLEAEGDSDIVDMAVEAAERNLAGAKISNEMLVQRIDDLKKEVETERTLRKEELQAERTARATELQAEREARKKEGEYLRRRIKDAEREARDYRSWAAKLVRQVVDAGKIPVTFVPSTNEDSESGISAITREDLENKKKE
jgi:hypothetical protein